VAVGGLFQPALGLVGCANFRSRWRIFPNMDGNFLENEGMKNGGHPPAVIFAG
jgi:hypothetical protein